MKRYAGAASLALITALVGLTPNAPAQTAPATLSIALDKPLHPVSPTLYGMMTEEINYSYDGGLYAELIRNRTFQDHGWAGVAHWYVDHAGDSADSMAMDLTQGPSPALPLSLAVTITKADPNSPAGVRNEGYWGIPLHPDTVYHASLYAKADSSSLGPLTVSLVNDNTGKVEATGVTAPVSGSWQQYQLELRTGSVPVSSGNHLLITAANPGKLWLSLVSLMPPTYHNRPNGNRIDLMDKMAGLHPKFLRLPGGNYLEGDRIDERFDWKLTIGPLVDRPTHPSPWGYTSTDGLGLLEFLEWSEDLKMQTVLAVYAGFSLKGEYIHPGPALVPFVDDALDEIEFATGDTSTKWGAVRAKLGHPAPFDIHYIEIGNEDEFDHSGSYEGRFAQFAAAIKAKYPQFQLIATTPLKRSKPDVIDDHYYRRSDEFFDDTHHYDKTDRNGPKVFVGEWATREGSPTTDMGAALGDAAWMTGLERNSDLVVMASYAPLLVNVNPGGMQWESDLIGFDALRAYGSPSYYTQSMFGEYLGTSVPSSTLSGAGSRLFYSVTNNPGNGKVYVKLVNASTDAQPIDVDLTGAGRLANTARLISLSGKTTAATNSMSEPEAITPVTSSLKVEGTRFKHTIPPLTIQVIVLSTRS